MKSIRPCWFGGRRHSFRPSIYEYVCSHDSHGICTHCKAIPSPLISIKWNSSAIVKVIATHGDRFSSVFPPFFPPIVSAEHILERFRFLCAGLIKYDDLQVWNEAASARVHQIELLSYFFSIIQFTFSSIPPSWRRSVRFLFIFVYIARVRVSL